MTATTITTTPGSDLRATRERAGITRAELARRAGCSLTFLANVEQGAVPRRSPTLDRVRAILDEENRPMNGTSGNDAGATPA
jgi:transcriptional regulator with XRE-family HTH domain